LCKLSFYSFRKMKKVHFSSQEWFVWDIESGSIAQQTLQSETYFC
jgi:hypothetical protein